MRDTILLELNELSPVLTHRFIADGLLPNFERFHEEADTYLTDAGEAPPYLEPWIQWVTVHTGVPRDRHRVMHLDEGHRVPEPFVWELLSRAGRDVWICEASRAT